MLPEESLESFPRPWLYWAHDGYGPAFSGNHERIPAMLHRVEKVGEPPRCLGGAHLLHGIRLSYCPLSQAVLKAVYVEDGKVKRAEYTDVFAALFSPPAFSFPKEADRRRCALAHAGAAAAKDRVAFTR